MFVHRLTHVEFFIGAAPRPQRRQAQEELARMLDAEGGLPRLRTALAQVLPPDKVERMPPEDVVAALAGEVAAGRFVLIGFRPRPVWAPTFAPDDGPGAGDAPPPDEEEEEQDWLEIELLNDGSPPQPVAGAKYLVELKDGTIVEGSLDQKGKARVEGIKKGAMSKVSFPEIDAKEWK